MVGSAGMTTSSLEVTDERLKAVLMSPLGMFYIEVLKFVLYKLSDVVCFLFEFVSIVVRWSRAFLVSAACCCCCNCCMLYSGFTYWGG